MRTQASQKNFNKLQDAMRAAKRILLSTHVTPDGDGLGAEYALYHCLKRAKKACRVYNPDPLPVRYQFLDPEEKILKGPGEVEVWDQFDLWVILDTNDPMRLGGLWSELSLRAKKIVFLDHHVGKVATQDNRLPPHAMIVSDTASSSIGELLFQIFEDTKLAKMNPAIALGLYVSVMTDTNSFRYARTTALAHRIAADMIDQGVNPEWVYQAIYSSKEVSHLKLLGHLLQNVQVAAQGKLAWLELPLELRKKHHAREDDTLSFLNLLLLLRDAEVVCIFREEENHIVKASIKSKGKIQINGVAQEFGGGGHEFASGFSLSATMNRTVEAATKRLKEVIDSHLKFGK